MRLSTPIRSTTLACAVAVTFLAPATSALAAPGQRPEPHPATTAQRPARGTGRPAGPTRRPTRTAAATSVAVVPRGIERRVDGVHPAALLV